MKRGTSIRFPLLSLAILGLAAEFAPVRANFLINGSFEAVDTMHRPISSEASPARRAGRNSAMALTCTIDFTRNRHRFRSWSQAPRMVRTSLT